MIDVLNYEGVQALEIKQEKLEQARIRPSLIGSDFLKLASYNKTCEIIELECNNSIGLSLSVQPLINYHNSNTEFPEKSINAESLSLNLNEKFIALPKDDADFPKLIPKIDHIPKVIKKIIVASKSINTEHRALCFPSHLPNQKNYNLLSNSQKRKKWRAFEYVLWSCYKNAYPESSSEIRKQLIESKHIKFFRNSNIDRFISNQWVTVGVKNNKYKFKLKYYMEPQS